MLGFFKNLLSSDKIVENASKGIDAAFLTNEEKTQYFLKYLEASMPMNISRRIIAIATCFMWVVCGIAIMTMVILDHPQTETVSEFARWYVVPSFTVLVSFYFWRRVKT